MASILIIDDNIAFGETLVQALRSAGHTSWHCPSAKVAFKLMQEQSIDLVITDIVMPDQDGLEVVMQLKKNHPRLRVILMSGDSPRHAPLYLAMGRKLGAVRTLLKPFSVRALFDTVAAVLGEGASPAAFEKMPTHPIAAHMEPGHPRAGLPMLGGGGAKAPSQSKPELAPGYQTRRE